MKPVCPNAAGDIRVPHDDVVRIVSHASARELPGIPSRRVMKRRSEDSAEDAGPAVQHLKEMARERAHRRRRAEQAGVPGDAAERRGVLVVHLAHQQPLPPRILFGRRDARSPAGRREELQVFARRHLRPHRVESLLKRHSAAEHDAEQHEAQIAVDGLRARHVLERRGADAGLERVLAL